MHTPCLRLLPRPACLDTHATRTCAGALPACLRWQVFEAGARVTNVVGLANAGISSDIARRMHAMQGIYH